MRDTLKIFLAKWRLDDTGAVKAFLLPPQDGGNLAKMLSERQAGFSYVYEEESRVGRFIASDGATVPRSALAGAVIVLANLGGIAVLVGSICTRFRDAPGRRCWRCRR